MGRQGIQVLISPVEMDFTRTGPWAALSYLAYSIRYRGLSRTCVLGYREWLKERELGIRTLGFEKPCSGDDSRYAAHIYQPSSSVLFSKAMGRLGIAPDGLHLLDVGCGKGRAMVLAAELGFATVTGIDIDPDLCRMAQENIDRVRDRFPATVFSVEVADAVRFGVPDGVDVAYLFNPFGKEMLAQWAAGISPARTRPLRIIYMHPVHLDVMLSGSMTLLHHDADGEFAVLLLASSGEEERS
jgi:SAM-dependent methyltransferase